MYCLQRNNTRNPYIMYTANHKYHIRLALRTITVSTDYFFSILFKFWIPNIIQCTFWQMGTGICMSNVRTWYISNDTGF